MRDDRGDEQIAHAPLAGGLQLIGCYAGGWRDLGKFSSVDVGTGEARSPKSQAKVSRAGKRRIIEANKKRWAAYRARKAAAQVALWSSEPGPKTSSSGSDTTLASGGTLHGGPGHPVQHAPRHKRR